MSVRTDVINLNINVNGSKAQAEMNNLRKRAADIKFEMQGLKKGTDEYIAKAKELQVVNGDLLKLKQTIGITALSQKELVQELARLKALKGSVAPFSQEFNDLSQKIKQVENRLYDVRNGVQGFASFFSKIKDEVKQFGVLAAGYLGFQFITTQFSNIIRSGGKLSDQLADIRRVTGLTADEVGVLNTQLSQLNTRTSTEGLRNIALIAGKLGVAKENIFEFTAAVDQLVVALGDELGDADQITTQLGKILNVFDKEGKVTGDNILKAGNAIVDLANKGVASGAFIVDFTQRLAGLAKTANLSLAASFGLGAGLEELGQRSESSSTAIVKVLAAIGQDVPKYAKIAGKSVEEFTKILRESPEEALIQVSEALVKGKKGFDEISAAFDAAGEDGAKVVTTLSVIGGKADFMRSKIKDAAGSLTETTEITEAFALKNETFGATLDKLGKEFNKLVTSSTVTSFLKAAVNGIVELIRFLKDLPQFLSENRTAIIALVGAYATYIAATTKATQATILNRAAAILSAAADKAIAIAKGIAAAATAAYGVVVDLLTGKIKLATVAQRIWNTVVVANPLAAIVAVITIAATAFSALTNKVKELSAAQKLNNEVQKRVVDATSEELNKVKLLASVVSDTNVSLDNRKKALQKLIDINPQYLGGLTLENIKTAEGKKLIDDYTKSLLSKAEAEAKSSLLTDKLKSRDNAFSLIRSQDSRAAKLNDEDLSKYIQQVGSNDLVGSIKVGDTKVKDIVQNLQQIKILQDDVTKLAKQNIDSVVGGTSTVITQSNKKTIGALKDQVQELDKAYEQIDITNKAALKKNRDDRAALQRQLDAFEGKKTPDQTKSDSEYNQLKKDAEKFYDDLLKLKQKAQIKGEEPEQREIDEVAQKYEELTQRAKDFYLKHVIDKKKFDAEEKLLEEAKQKEIDAILQKYFKERQDKQNAANYDKDQNDLDTLLEVRKRKYAQMFADGIIDQKQYNDKVHDLEGDQLSDRIAIAENYKGTVKKAADDLVKYKKQSEEQTTKDLIDETEKRIATSNEEKLARADRGVITSRGKGVDAEIDAKKNQLQTRFDIETEFMDKTSEMYKTKQAELNDELGDLDREETERKIDNVLTYVGYFQDALSSLNQFISNRENRLLANEKRANDVKKKEYKQQLDSKLISQAQYDKKTQAIDDQQQKHENEVKRKQAQREKALNLFNAVVSNAAAIAKTMASVPFPANIPLAIAQGIAGGLQIAAIANTPLPELGTGDWIRKGDKHKDPSGGIPVKIERDEAVMKADAMTDQKVLTVTGTTAQITSALNSRKGGASWAFGAKVVEMPRWLTEKPASINPGLPRIMEQGGIVRDLSGINEPSSAETNSLLKQLIAKQEENTTEIKNMKSRLHAVVSIKEYREEEAKYDAAKKASGLNQ